MSDSNGSTDVEFAAMQAVYSAIEPLDDDARDRVIKYIVDRLGIESQATVKSTRSALANSDESDLEKEQTRKSEFGTLAELFDSTLPKSNSDKALIAGYWLQVCQAAESFDSQSANTELKHLGYGVPNITAALTGLKDQKPALILQLRKSGKSQQARKTYKLSAAGEKRVEEMIDAIPQGQ